MFAAMLATDNAFFSAACIFRQDGVPGMRPGIHIVLSILFDKFEEF
jgi:hypothetical protein